MEYFREIPQMFRYAARGEGPKVAIGGGFALGFLVGVGHIDFPLAGVAASLAMLPVVGFLFGYVIDVARIASRGQDYPADLPNVRDPVGTFARPLGAYLFLTLMAYLPLFAAIGIRTVLGPLGGLVDLVVAVAGLAGFAAFPILFLRFAVSGSYKEMANLPETYTSALKVLPFYGLTLVLFLILWAFAVLAWVLLSFGTGRFPGGDSPFTHGLAAMGLMAVFIYFFVGQAFLLGRLYQHFKDKLRWTI